jgi:hypothetical protein
MSMHATGVKRARSLLALLATTVLAVGTTCNAISGADSILLLTGTGGGGGTGGSGGTSSVGASTTSASSNGSVSSSASGGACTEASTCTQPATLCKTVACTGGMCAVSNAPRGTTCNDAGGTTCDGAGDCVSGKYVFVTKTTMLPDYGSATQADAICASTAANVGFAGTWLSWTSDSTTSPAMRFQQATVPYLLLDGTIVADDWTQLTSGTILVPIDIDETGGSQTGVEVWTGTATDGTYSGNSCMDWTSTASTSPPLGDTGVTNVTDGGWTDVYMQFCNRVQRLYCFMQ